MPFPDRAEGGALAAMDTLPLGHTWPIWDRSQHFELGHVLSSVVTDAVKPPNVGQLGIHHAGCWECNLSDNSLTWSGGVYDIFGLPRDVPVHRDDAVAYYSDECRTKMERLRAYSIKHRRGFTLDVKIRAATGDNRLMRLIAEPVLYNARIVGLQGLKLII
jgi:PAS domain-containing protein